MGHDYQSQLNQLRAYIKDLQTKDKDLLIEVFPLSRIPEAVNWAERGGIAIHENFHTKRRYSYHVISAQKEKLERFCALVNLPQEKIKASEFYRFWHLTWTPFPPPVKKKRPRGRPRKNAA